MTEGLFISGMSLPNSIQGVRILNVWSDGTVTNSVGEEIARAANIRFAGDAYSLMPKIVQGGVERKTGNDA